MDLKPGYRTTEFWVAGIPGIIITALNGLQAWDLNFPVWIGPIMTVFYVLSRGLAKSFLKGD